MKNVTFSGFTRSYGTMTGELLAIFSRQPVVFNIDSRDNLGTRCRLTLHNGRNSRSMSEVRETVQGSGYFRTAEFEVSRMLQLVTDADTVLQRITYEGEPQSIADTVQFIFESYVGNSWRVLANAYAEVIPAAVDWLETLTSKKVTRRIWANFPQTISCGHDGFEEIYLSGDSDNTIYLQYPTTRTGYEVDVMKALENERDGLESEIASGGTGLVSISYQNVIANGQGTLQANDKLYLCKGQTAPMGNGVYLRWLHRDGSVGYWLFNRSKETVNVSSALSYSAPISGVPAQPQGHVIQNPARQFFDVSEAWVIGTPDVSEDEYAYLLGLAQSPVVEMLVGGTRTVPEWVRVSVLPASYSRELPKSGLSRLRDFEIQVVPPQRNTVKL